MSGSQGLRRFVTSTSQPAPADTAIRAEGGVTEGGVTEAAMTMAGLAVAGIALPDVSTSPGQPSDTEKCELCATEIPEAHSHLADLENSSLLCACRACYLLFTQPDAGRGRYRSVPDRYVTDPVHPVSVGEWESLEIPVGLAFFMRDSRQGEVTGFYPSPAGATQCELDLAAWDELGTGHPLLAAMAPDVEAVLITRSEAVVESYVVPIDTCYELAGRMRLLWRGFDGGDEARASIAQFLDHVRGRARSLDREA